MRRFTLIFTSLVLTAAFAMTSCEKDDDKDPKTIIDVAVDNEFKVLAKAIAEANLYAALSGMGPFTLFAPTDAAFNAIGITVDNVGQVEGLETILKYHVISGRVFSSSLTSGTVTMLSGAEAQIDATNLTINDANIIDPFDLEGSNGVVHSIDAVLLPPENIVVTAIEAGYNVLAAGLVAAGLDATLQGNGPFTVFAPTDATFNAAGITVDNIADVAGLSEILLYHVVAGNVTSADLSTGDVETLNGQTIAIDAAALTVNGASIVSPFDVNATNGVIHTIDDILIPSFNIVTSALFYGYDRLAEAVVEAGLTEALTAIGPFTVFAPTNDAFDAFYADLGVSGPGAVDGETLQAVLLYHVLSGEVTSGDLVSGKVETLAEKFVTIDAAELKIDDANIISPIDVPATNGVIHTIDAVISPAKNIVEAALATPDLSILVEILTIYPDLINVLSDETGEFTVFAPTNAAFAALLGVIGQSSVEDIPEDVLRNILDYHVLAGAKVMSTDLSDGLTATTVNGEDILVSAANGSFLISGAGINSADVVTSNGVVHVMNDVLVPPSVAQYVNTIVQPAYFNKNFTTLIAAVKAADPSILEILLGDGPGGAGMTLFAPTNDAFVAAGITSLPGQETLNAVLAYHLIDGVVMSSDLPSTGVADPATVAAVGGDLYLSNKGDGVFLNGNTMITAVDIDPSGGEGTANGIVHLIDRTLLPPSQNIVEIAIDLGFTSLAAALTEANLVDPLLGEGPFTVFAPTNEAFTQLYSDLGVDGPEDLNSDLLTAVLLYHVLDLRAFSTDLEDALEATSLSGETFTINLSDGASITDGTGATSNITDVNVLGTNGVIHVIDQVLLPPADDE